MLDGVRFAESKEEFWASYHLRYKIYVERMGMLKDKANHETKELRDEQDDNARAIIAIKDGQPIGTLRLFWGGDAPFSQTLIKAYHLELFLKILKQNQICIIERLMVDEPFRRSNTTLQMYKEIINFVLAHHVEAALLDCEPHHLNSYLKLGFRPIGATYSYPGIGLVIPMLLIAGDYEHMKGIGSPFALLVREVDLGYCKHANELLNNFGQSSNLMSHASANKSEFINQINADTSLLANDSPKIFDLLTQDELDRVIDKSHIIECKLGDHIIEQNNAAKTIFVLLSGIAKVERDGQLQALISPGEVIGEIAFFLNVPRTANIIAATSDVKVLSIDDAAISRLLKYDGTLANKILLNLCRLLCTRVINNFETSNLREKNNTSEGLAKPIKASGMSSQNSQK